MKRWLIVVILASVLCFIIVVSWKFLLPVLTQVAVDDSIPVSQLAVQEAITKNLFAQLRNADYAHLTTGQVLVLREGNISVLRFENLGTSGSGLSIMLAKNLSGTEKVWVDQIKSSSPNQNYNLSSDISVSEYPYVLLWDNHSSVLYGWAKFKTNN